MLAVVHRIAEAVNIPVTADVEAGYGAKPEEVAETARAVLAAGAVGMNLEDVIHDRPDALADLGLQKEKIRAVIETSARAGVPLVLNTRTDVTSGYRPRRNAAGAQHRAAQCISRCRSPVLIRSWRER